MGALIRDTHPDEPTSSKHLTLTAQENRARAVIAGRFVKTAGDAHVLDQAALARARRLAGLRRARAWLSADGFTASPPVLRP